MKELFRNTWAEMDQGVRIFLLAGEERALVIDSGMTGPDIESMVRAHTALPYRLLNTHADLDHIGGNAQFDEIYMHPSEMAFYHKEQHGPGTVIPVFGGDRIDLGGRELEIVHLPGHTPGSIAVLDRQSRSLFSGDPIQENGEIFMFGAHRDLGAYIAGLKKLSERDDFDFIYPSHGTEKVSRGILPALIDGAARILSGELKGKEVEVFGTKVSLYDAGAARFLCEL